MSGILGFYNFYESSLNSIEKISYRGKNRFDFNSKYFNACFVGDKNIFLNQNKEILVAENQITNWKKLSSKYDLNSENKEDFLYYFLNKFNLDKIDELEGAYAFGYYKDDKIVLIRDIVGVKPICYYHKQDKFAFSSESKALPKESQEMNPRTYIVYDCKTNNLDILNRKRYYDSKFLIQESFDEVKKNVKALLIKSIKKKVKKGDKIGILFSGGTDSTLMALLLDELGIDFTCYTTSITTGNIKEGHDVYFARRIVKERNFKWKLVQNDLDEIIDLTKEIMTTIEDSKYTKVSVALVLFMGLKKAGSDGIDYMFSGIGSEEVFADYKRAVEVDNINETCVEGLKSLWVRDLYRDDTLAKSQRIELVYPFLDDEFVDYSIRIDSKFKINKDTMVNKIILREIIRDFGLSIELVERKKTAAQYGCKSDRIYEKLSKKKKMLKQEYLDYLNEK